MYEFGLNNDILDFIVDDSPLKQIMDFTFLYASSSIEKFKPDYLLILAWNFAESIIKKILSFINQGRFIVPW